MEQPKNIKEIEAWLGPLGYDEFWEAITPHCPGAATQYRAECDAYVLYGIYSRDEALRAYKFVAIEAFAWKLDPAYDIEQRGLETVTLNHLARVH